MNTAHARITSAPREAPGHSGTTSAQRPRPDAARSSEPWGAGEVRAGVPEGVRVEVTVVQVVRGGEPDDEGVSFAGRRSPLAPALGTRCPCAAVVLPYGLWDAIDRHDLYSSGTDLWVRTVTPGDASPLPEGAELVEAHTVVCGSD